jgi:NitT/TauT family transport system substrate-binding protein
MTHTRRRFLAAVSIAGVTGAVGGRQVLAAEEGLETTSVRLANSGLCIAPQYVAEGLLRSEGFTDVRYIDATTPERKEKIARREIDFSLDYASSFVPAIDAGKRITALAGVHVGCQELFAREGIRTVADLKGKSVGVQAVGSTPHMLVTIMAAQVGLTTQDIHWITDPAVKPIDLFVEGKIDAFMGFPPEPQDLRARQIGHVILNTAVDRPWSQYYCCMLGGNREFIRKHPLATKRVLRAVLKAADLCATEPARCTTDRRWRFHLALRLCPASTERASLRQMARIRSRGHDPVLCPAPTRSGLHQGEPAKNHRRRHRLAFLQ